MANIGLGELFLIGVLLLVVVGPERLPGILRQVGRYYGMLRRTALEFQHAFFLEAEGLSSGRADPLAPGGNRRWGQEQSRDSTSTDPAREVAKVDIPPSSLMSAPPVMATVPLPAAGEADPVEASPDSEKAEGP